MSAGGRPYAPVADADPRTLLALTRGSVGVEMVVSHPVPHLRALCRRCGSRGPTRRFSRLFTRDALAVGDRERLVAEMREHACDERVVVLAVQDAPRAIPDHLVEPALQEAP